MAAEDAPWRVGFVALTFARHDRVRQERVDTNDADATTPLASRGGLVAQLVAIGPHREAPLELLDRVVAGVGDQVVDRVHRVAVGTPTVRTLIDLEVDPVLALFLDEAGIGKEVDMRRVTCRDLVGDHWCERTQDEIDSTLRLREARKAGPWVFRVVDRALGRDHLDRTKHALVLGDEDRVGGLVEEHHAGDKRHARDRRALVRAVVARRHLGARAGQVDNHLVAFDAHNNLDWQLLATVASVVVEPAVLGAVLAVGDLGDLLAEHPLGVIHPMVGCAQHSLFAVAPDEVCEAILGALAGRDHGLDVAPVVGRGAGVLENVLKQRLLPDALVGQLDGTVDVALGPVVDEVDREAREGATDIEQVGRGTREADQLALMEDGHHNCDVGRVGRAEVRIVVENDVAGVDVVAEQRDDALDDLRHRAHKHRSRVGLGDVVALSVKQSGTEILGLANDRRVRHAVEDAGHLLRDGVEGAADHAHQDRLGESRVTTRSPACLDALGDVDDEIAEAVDVDHKTRRHDRRRVVLLDNCGAGDAVASL